MKYDRNAMSRGGFQTRPCRARAISNREAVGPDCPTASDPRIECRSEVRFVGNGDVIVE
jgi:hypothetical protein